MLQEHETMPGLQDDIHRYQPSLIASKTVRRWSILPRNSKPLCVREATILCGSILLKRMIPPSYASANQGLNGTSTFIKIAVAVVLLIIAGVAALGLAGAAFYYGSSTAKPEPTPTRTPAPSPTLDDEKRRLKDEIANIQKRLDERKRNANTDSADDDLHDASVTATVNSPNDGFLALRTEPDADRGTRLAKIPHGDSVEVLNCEKQFISIAGRSGRWCLVEYSGQTGWVFDGFLDY